jgi:hypothetical protein
MEWRVFGVLYILNITGVTQFAIKIQIAETGTFKCIHRPRTSFGSSGETVSYYLCGFLLTFNPLKPSGLYMYHLL